MRNGTSMKDGNRAARFARVTLALFIVASGARLPAATSVEGTVSGEWTAANSPYHAIANLAVDPGATLTIDAGVTVTFDPDISLVVQGTLQIAGTAEAGVKFLRATAATAWGGVAITGAGASAAIDYLELTGATVAKSSLPGFPTDFPAVFKMTDHAKVHIQHSWFHDFPNPVIDNSGQGELTILDSLIENCMESIHSAASYADIERVHIQHLHGYSDFIDFDNDSTPHSIVRDCLLEDNPDDGADGIDTLETNCLIENVIIKNVPTDKGFDMEGKSTPVIRNCLAINCRRGLAVKDGCTPEVHNLTVVGSELAVWCFQKNAGKGGGHLTADSLILWGNTTQFTIDSLSSAVVTYSDVEGGLAGVGNIDLDPRFVDAAGGDFHLAADSPAIGAGKAGSDMGGFPYTGPHQVKFVRGDANGDKLVDISDPLAILFHLFAGRGAACLEALDADDSSAIDLTDVVFLLLFLFQSGSPPSAPYPDPAINPDPVDLGCEG